MRKWKPGYKRGVNDVRFAESAAVVLAVFVVAFFVFLIALSLQEGGDLMQKGWSRAHPQELAMLGSAAGASALYCWIVSWRVLDHDDLSDRARKRWAACLLLLSAFAGISYILSREVRRQRSRKSSSS
jgi:protein-S-isoprenylcysteine O-methyltransferase Ste14